MIVAYRPKNLTESNLKPNKDDSERDLDSELKEIQKTIPVDWDHTKEHTEINKALMGNNKTLKEIIIRKFSTTEE